MISGLAQDLRYAIRQLRHSPGFFFAASSLIAIGIAAATLIFSLVNALLLKPLPVRNSENLVQLFGLQPKRPAEPFFYYEFFKRLSSASSTVFKFVGQTETVRALEFGGHAERVHVIGVTENYFADLGVDPFLGRTIGFGDDHVAVLSYDYWSRLFAHDPMAIGQTVRIQGHAYTIVGVANEDFGGTLVDSRPDLWIPFANQGDFSRTPSPNLDQFLIEVIGRLRPGVRLQQAEQETTAFWSAYVHEELTRGSARERLAERPPA